MYKGDEPFSIFLKKYFATRRKHGSRDRKQIAHLCYCFFRLGKAHVEWSAEQRIIAGLFLISRAPNEILEALQPGWNAHTRHSIDEKAAIAGVDLTLVFPWKDELSTGIDPEKFNTSFFIQPDLFLRVRPGCYEEVIVKLKQASLSYKDIPPFAISLPPATKTDEFLQHDKEVVVQDLNSQRVGEMLELAKKNLPPVPAVWDCCAASGGKSMLAKDILGTMNLTVTDVRENILLNLRKRFNTAGIKHYRSIVADLAKQALPGKDEYDLVIADLPCTGSGTWGRTPEQLYSFEENRIIEYATLQKMILSNTVPSLKRGGQLLYITCSVFQKENEEVIAYLEKEFQLKSLKQELLKGYELKADTLFAALLIR